MKQRSESGFGKVGVAYHDVAVFLAQRDQRLAEGLARGHAELEFKFRGGRHYCNSCSARFTSSGVGAVPWNFGLFSMNETPLPLMVWAMTAVGLPFGGRRFLKRGVERGQVVPVDIDGVPAKRSPLVDDGLDFHDVLDEAIQLNAVGVHNGHHVIDLVVTAEHRAFPDLAFLNLAVAHHGVRPGRAAIQARRQRHAERERNAFAQRSRRSLQRRKKAHVRMALVHRAQLAKRVQLVRGTVSGLGHHRVEHRRGVALGQDKAVAVRPFGIGGIVPHDAEVEREQNFNGRKRSARMPGARRANHFDNRPAHALGHYRQFIQTLRLLHGSLHCNSRAAGFAKYEMMTSAPARRIEISDSIMARS